MRGLSTKRRDMQTMYCCFAYRVRPKTSLSKHTKMGDFTIMHPVETSYLTLNSSSYKVNSNIGLNKHNYIYYGHH